jgi:hypothetical protein
MTRRKLLSICVGFLPVLVFVLAVLELFHVSGGDISSYPFGSERAGFFSRSVLHYKVGLAIDILLSTCGIWGAVGIWLNRRKSWLFLFPLLVWLILPWLMFFTRGHF